ncbi:MAG: hypothetical protein QOF51_1849 [Chloroflexota bacterium]|jgi:hypothetical protein|nr:hypothetical protein [Chloroflexota bacterium]
MGHTFIVTGTLRDNHTVQLDYPVSLESKKVRVTLEPLQVTERRPYTEVMAEIRRRQDERGHRPPSLEEVDQYLAAERESWGE